MSNRLAHVLEAKWRSGDVNTNEGRDFSSLHLDERILAGLSNAGYRIPSPVQLQAIPLCLTGGDVFVQGKAGTGKTLVFSILALTAVLEADDLEVLIVAPTREGAFQIYNTICAIGSEVKDLKCECFIGGFSYAEDIPKARGSKIAVGTPGRLLHLIQDGKLKIDTIRLFIIDDFDELLNKYLKPEVSDIFHILPEKKQTVVASLTCTDEVMKLASEFLNHRFLACFNENELSLLGMAHYYYIVPVNYLPLLSYRRKLEVLKSVLFKVKFSQCVIFCNTVHRVEPLCIDIQMWGFSVVSMSKAKDQVERLQAVELLKKNKCKVLVSTDVSSRGLDVENVDLVINFDMPSNCRIYLHRCGRAGRYGAKCSSITFLFKNQTEQFDKIENEGQFNSYALPEPIPEEINCDINPSAVPSMPYNLRTGCNSKENFLASSTEFSKNAIINLEKTTAGESCSLLIANENRETGLEDVDEGYSVLIANEIEEQTVDLETVNTTHLMRDFEMIKLENECAEDCQDTSKIKDGEACLLLSCEENAELPDSLKINTNQQLEVFNEECESKNCEQSLCKTAHTPYRNEVIGERAIDDKDSATVSSECKSLPLNDSLESLIISSGRETSEIETDTGNEYSSFEEIDLCSASKTVPKSTLKIKSTSKSTSSSEEYVLHKAFDKMHLEREENCRKKVMKIPQVTRNKKKSYKNIRNICNKKSVKSLDHCKNQSKSERPVMFCGSKTTSFEFDANQSCTKFYSGYPANHMDKKKVNKNHKMHSTRGKSLDRCDCLSQTCNFNVQRNPRPCCHFPNNYCHPPFLLHRDDIFYKQWMFINNFSYFLSYVK